MIKRKNIIIYIILNQYILYFMELYYIKVYKINSNAIEINN